LVAAAPGVGKSVMGLRITFTMRVPSLYLACDSDEDEMLVRTVQMGQNLDQETAERQIAEGGILARQVFEEVDYVRFDFPGNPDIEEIVERTRAFAEASGEWPQLIVVDNLMDVAWDDGTEREGHNSVMSRLGELARAARAAVLVLAHVTGQYEDGNQTIPLSGLMNKIGKKPRMVLTICNGSDRQVWVSVLKNRRGNADPSGLGVRIPLRVDYARMQMGDTLAAVP